MWADVHEGKIPLVVSAANPAAVLHLLKALAPFKKVKLVIFMGGELPPETVDAIKAHGAGVILRPGIETEPGSRDRFNAARMLNEAGVEFAFSLTAKPPSVAANAAAAAFTGDNDAPLTIDLDAAALSGRDAGENRAAALPGPGSASKSRPPCSASKPRTGRSSPARWPICCSFPAIRSIRRVASARRSLMGGQSMRTERMMAFALALSLAGLSASARHEEDGAGQRRQGREESTADRVCRRGYLHGDQGRHSQRHGRRRERKNHSRRPGRRNSTWRDEDRRDRQSDYAGLRGHQRHESGDSRCRRRGTRGGGGGGPGAVAQ